MNSSSLSNTRGGGAGDRAAAGSTPAQTREGGLGEEASALASDAADAGRHVVDVAKDESRSVASETKDQARRLLGQVGDELNGQATAQQARLAEGLHSAGAEFSEMADGSTRSGYAADLVRGAGRRADAAARWLEQRDPRSVLEEVKGYARRRPGVFIAIAVGAGILAGRLTRAMASPPDRPASGGGRLPTGTDANRGATAPEAPPLREVPPPTATTVGTGATGSARATGSIGVTATGTRAGLEGGAPHGAPGSGGV
ncbi:hypothetical protein MUN74_15580 [Agromyces endophyticus]|uniref:hypothetical protein n=1 Tax=Agromyces sp. H17E-10 TaxID=2932244 RepID=UPI001FD13E16|nr:hypothetical protein [Agromyces sp. H17E-10]UOQ88672.1 hypothetical protein MUN74_15580 [Agromyces sp. H17E-10]